MVEFLGESYFGAVDGEDVVSGFDLGLLIGAGGAGGNLGDFDAGAFVGVVKGEAEVGVTISGMVEVAGVTSEWEASSSPTIWFSKLANSSLVSTAPRRGSYCLRILSQSRPWKLGS